jgi:long-chain acyl-CoA synthetase
MTLAYLAEVQAVEPGDAILHAAPLSHGSGLYNFAYVARGGINVVPRSRGFDADEVLDLAQAFPGVSMFAAPTVVKRIVAACEARPGACESIGRIVYGGGPMYLADIEEALRVMGPRFAQIYGRRVADDAHRPAAARDRRCVSRALPDRLQSVGHAQVNVEIAVATNPAHGCPPARSARCAPAADRHAGLLEQSRGDCARRCATVGCTRANVGCLDADGFLTLKDRSKDVIISGGRTSTRARSRRCSSLHPRVREAAVVGTHDPEWGEAVVAFVVGPA